MSWGGNKFIDIIITWMILRYEPGAVRWLTSRHLEYRPLLYKKGEKRFVVEKWPFAIPITGCIWYSIIHVSSGVLRASRFVNAEYKEKKKNVIDLLDGVRMRSWSAEWKGCIKRKGKKIKKKKSTFNVSDGSPHLGCNICWTFITRMT